MNRIRQANSDDLDAFYHISLKTGHLGGDASHLYFDTQMLGHIYSAPYLKYEPELAVVVERNGAVLGYCVGTLDTNKFEVLLESKWWPSLRWKYQKPDENTQSDWSPDERRCQMIHQPETTPRQIVDRFPAHIHMNLLPEVQGGGVGTLLLNYWMRNAVQLDATAVHIGASAQNERAIRFWTKQGFKNLDGIIDLPSSRTVWMGRHVSLLERQV